MRLIDANKLRIEFVEEGNIVKLPHISLEQLMRTEEVKAVPTKWLKFKADEMADKFWSNADIYGNRRLILPMKDLPNVIKQMIDEWEKENEID